MGWSFNHWIEWLKWAFSKGVRSRKVSFCFSIPQSVLSHQCPVHLHVVETVESRIVWYSSGSPDYIGARSEAWIVSLAFGFQSLHSEKKVWVLQEDFVVCVFISPVLNHQLVQRKPGCLKYKHVMKLMQTAESEGVQWQQVRSRWIAR